MSGWRGNGQGAGMVRMLPRSRQRRAGDTAANIAGAVLAGVIAFASALAWFVR